MNAVVCSSKFVYISFEDSKNANIMIYSGVQFSESNTDIRLEKATISSLFVVKTGTVSLVFIDPLRLYELYELKLQFNSFHDNTAIYHSHVRG